MRSNNGVYRSMLPAVIIFTIIYLFINFVQGTPIVDDAYIYYRYADNWASGYGPVFNIDEYVEGNTNFLWTVILMIGASLSFDLESIAPFVNYFIGISCVALMSYLASLIPYSRSNVMTIFLPVVYTLSYGVYMYGVAGMDTLLFSLLLLLCVIGFINVSSSGKYFRVLPPLILLTLSRPEAPVYALVMLGVLACFVMHDKRNLPSRLFLVIGAYICFTAVIFIARYSVYHEFIPSTVQAKGYATYLIKKFISEGDLTSLKRFAGVILSGLKYEAPLLFVGAWIPYIVLFKNRSKGDYLLWIIGGCIGVNIFVSIWAGGDFFLYNRHVIPVFPLLIVFVAWGIDMVISRYVHIFKGRVLYALLTVVLLLWGLFLLKPIEITNRHGIKPHFRYLKELGILMKELPGPTVLLTDRAGIMPYFAGINVYVRDLFGLMDAHNAKHGDTFCTPSEGGVCGRTDYVYSFSTPFDIFVYNAKSINRRFVLFCEKNPDICSNYRFLKKEEWKNEKIYVIVDNRHPAFGSLQEKFGTVPVPVDGNMLR